MAAAQGGGVGKGKKGKRGLLFWIFVVLLI